jgi:hypothetical protein
VAGRGRIYVSFQLSDLKEMKRDLGNYTDNPDQSIQFFITIIQIYDLAWKDVMLLLDQTLTSLEKSWPRSSKGEMIFTSNGPLCTQPQGMREKRCPRYQQGHKQFPKQEPIWVLLGPK